ncbi:MAG: SRPBCC family protein [Candidatus Dormibacteria bacterium]
MDIKNSFHVNAAPDRVYKFLLDVNSVARCMPGAELSEVVDPNTFKGKVKIKVGPVVVNYNGVARITSRDEVARSAVLEAEGRETQGAGSARATATMSVVPDGTGSEVTLSTSMAVAGRVAQFGRGVMEDVSRRLVTEMANCIRENVEAPAAAEGAGTGEPAAQAAADHYETKPVNALALLFAVLLARLRALFGSHRTEANPRR